MRLSLRLRLYQKRIATSNVATVGEIVEVLSYFHFYPSARVWELELLYFTLLQRHQLNKLINFANNFMTLSCQIFNNNNSEMKLFWNVDAKLPVFKCSIKKKLLEMAAQYYFQKRLK